MIYFDNGATTFPKPQAVIRAADNAMRNFGANPGRSGHKMSVRASEIVYECRKNAAKLFGLDNPENIIFTNNCTCALNIVIKGTLKCGDHAIISCMEHNAVARPMEFMRSQGVDYTVVDYVFGDNEATLDNFRKAIRSNTKLIVCTHASNVFGVRFPIERLAAMCKIYNILFCVDAAQTAGVLPISMNECDIDYLCTAGHKGLYGPMGTGILAINSDIHPRELTQGGTGSESANLRQPETLPDKYESGTPNLSGIAGLNEGICFVLNRGEERIFSYEMRLAQKLYDGLARNDAVILYTSRPEQETHVPVISFNIKGHDSEEIAAMLSNRFNIAVRAGLHCAPLAHRFYGTEENGTVRAVMSAFINDNSVNYFINSINKIVKLLPKKVAIG